MRKREKNSKKKEAADEEKSGTNVEIKKKREQMLKFRFICFI